MKLKTFVLAQAKSLARFSLIFVPLLLFGVFLVEVVFEIEGVVDLMLAGWLVITPAVRLADRFDRRYWDKP